MMLKIKTFLHCLFLFVLLPLCFSCGENPKNKTSTDTSEDKIIDDTVQMESNAENDDFQHSAKDEGENGQISDLIIVEKPLRDEKISSPLQIEGKARGYWFFEGSAPVVLVDNGQKEIATGVIEAKGEWMTEDFVPFQGVLEFNTTTFENGFLILKRANPSGKTANDQNFLLPVEFSSNGEK